MLGFSGQVIAAQDVIDQPAAAPQTISQAISTSESPPSLHTPATSPAAQQQFTMSNTAMLVLSIAAVSLFLVRGWHRLEHAPKRPEAFSPIAGLSLLVAMLFLRIFAAKLALQAMGIAVLSNGSVPQLSIDQMAKLTMFVYGGQLLGLAVYLFMRVTAKPSATADLRQAAIDSRLPRNRAAILGGGTLVMAWPVVLVASSLIAWLRGVPVDPIAHDTLRELVNSPIDSWYIVLASLVVLGAPLMEEVMYRGLLQNAMVQVGVPRWPAIALASAVFAIMHIGSVAPHAIAALFVLSLALGWSYEKTGRLTAPIMLHLLFNAGNLAAALWSART